MRGTDVPGAGERAGASARCGPAPAQPGPVPLRPDRRDSACRARRPTTCCTPGRRRLRRAPAPTSAATGSASRPTSSAAATSGRHRCSGSPGGRSPGSSTGPGTARHLAVLHGREVLYVIEERAPGRPPLVTDVGVRLPAQLTASGRAMLAALPPAQVRALFPDRTAFVDRHGAGPPSLTALRRLLVETPAAGLRDRGRRGHPRLRVGRRRGRRPHRPPGRGPWR